MIRTVTLVAAIAACSFLVSSAATASPVANSFDLGIIDTTPVAPARVVESSTDAMLAGCPYSGRGRSYYGGRSAYYGPSYNSGYRSSYYRGGGYYPSYGRSYYPHSGHHRGGHGSSFYIGFGF